METRDASSVKNEQSRYARYKHSCNKNLSLERSQKGGKMVKGERNTRGTHTRFLVRSHNNLFIATLASRPTLEPQTKGFPSVSPTRGVLVFVLQCLSVL